MKGRMLAVLMALIPALVLAQSPGTISGPSMGYVFDSRAGTIRPLLGIVGSAMVGEPLDLGFSITNAISLRDERYILASPQDGPYLLLVNLSTAPPVTKVIKGAAKSGEITLSPNGKAAALTYPAGRLIEVITGLPDKPAISVEITTSFLFETQPHYVAVNDDASVLLMSFVENGRESIYRWNGTEGFRLLASISEVGTMAFVGTYDAVYADRNSNEIFIAHDVKRMSVTKFIAGSSDGVSNPVGIGVSSKSGFYVANAGSQSIMTFDNSGRLLRTEQCSCTISGMFPLGSNTYRLTDMSNPTIHILDDNSAVSRILFVPPVPRNSQPTL